MDGSLMEEKKIEALWKLYIEERSVELRNELVLEYMGLVKNIVLRFRGSYSNFGQLDDMINQGIIALIDAIERFDPDQGAKFESFAYLKIRGAVIDFMRKQDWVPRNQRTMAKELDDIYGELYAEKGHEPSREDIAKRMDITVDHLDKIMQQRHNAIVLSYEETINEKMMIAAPLIDNSKDWETPEQRILHGELKEKLIEAIDLLNERERLVISLYYYENLKLKEIAEVLGVTESRVSQIHSASILKMKHNLNRY